MQTYPIAEAKSHFSELISQVEQGKIVFITRGTKKEEVAVMVPFKTWQNQTQKVRKLGTLKGKMHVAFNDDWHISDEELLGQ
jgi:prevent-host-death family protein